GDREIQHARSMRTSVLEVMSRARGCEHEGASGCIDPAVADEKTHRALDDVEDVVFELVGMRSRTLRVRLQPPLGDGIGASGLVSVRLEDRADAPHRIRAPVSRREKDAGSLPRATPLHRASTPEVS